MSSKKLKSDRSLRAKLRSPGRPPVLHRSERWPFWKAIAEGRSSEDAANTAGVSPAVGNRWFRQCSGTPPSRQAPWCARPCRGVRLAARGASSDAPPCSAPRPRLRAGVAATPCQRHRPAGSPQTRAAPESSNSRHAALALAAAPGCAGAPRDAGTPTGQPAAHCRSARPHEQPAARQ